MFEIMTVCTGNICRSPLAAELLRTRLSEFSPTITSAGTRGLPAAQMTPEAQRLAIDRGVPEADAAAHRSRFLLEQFLVSPDLILAMTREHRREIAELAPSRLRHTFTVREFARLAQGVSDEQIVDAASAAGADPSARVRAMAALVASQRGLALPPADASDDDVIDPYRRSWETYLRSANQLEPAVDAVVHAVTVALAS
ncbi:low molecular weight phosphatase family protein [Microbacterium sp. C7(2022)]|uniref:arsenate reductase/protein-tyrosine-phosphatase family protein n=1 Tax=Microbacterium sp. C7(2022) TaxID=2992759 RepID=UPI00237C4830|nr:low molecular weight phosphatase family protein [Microbacterium sp. C7(2022)]MDE0545403.1 low molecular weight phosphatase family protein [Microbacterium sp. C7(2022)]